MMKNGKGVRRTPKGMDPMASLGPGGGRQRVMRVTEGVEVGENLWIHDAHSIQMLQEKTEYSRKLLLNSILQMHRLRLIYDGAAVSGT